MINSRNIVGILAIVVGVTYLLSLLPAKVLIGAGAWLLAVVLILAVLAGGSRRTPAEQKTEDAMQAAWIDRVAGKGK